jgi:hypothetical protein
MDKIGTIEKGGVMALPLPQLQSLQMQSQTMVLGSTRFASLIAAPVAPN